MKKMTKKLSLNAETVRVLSGPELENAVGGTGGVAQPTTTVFHRRPTIAAAAGAACRLSANAAGAVACRVTGTVHTAPCAYTL